MKKLSKLLVAVLTLTVALCALTACQNEGEDQAPDRVVIVAEGVTQPCSLQEYMTEKGVDFTISDGLIVSVNGKKNTTNSYWMIYTSDENNANSAWGTLDYEGQTLGSAVVGAGELTVAEGEIYVLAYQTF